jgi:hypothetical protein
VLSVFSAAATTEVEDVDGEPPGGVVGISSNEPPWGCCQYFRQRPPMKLKTSMMGPMTSITICSDVSKNDVDSNK